MEYLQNMSGTALSMLGASAAAALFLKSSSSPSNDSESSSMRSSSDTDGSRSPPKKKQKLEQDDTSVLTDVPSEEIIERTLQAIQDAFPDAIPNSEFVSMLHSQLSRCGYNGASNTLVATSLCCDEVNRPLVDELERRFGQTFSMGGLAGFAFGGVTSFGAMAHHIPDNGNCLLVYGPHVGVDTNGNLGTVNRRGRSSGGACCGSAAAAAGYVAECRKCQKQDRSAAAEDDMSDPIDAQQQYVNKLLLPYGDRLEEATNKQAELPRALFESQNDLVKRIVAKGCSNVEANEKIALVGGIQINTPGGMADYFLPLTFELRNNKGELMEDFMHEKCALMPTLRSISDNFPSALPNDQLVSRVKRALSSYGYGKSTLLATSLCCDEVNKPLIDAFSAIYGNNFSMGGLAGFPFGGVTSFGAMAHHIPDGGSCLVVYGPHVGVDSTGKIGTVERRGRKSGGACCGSAAAAAEHVEAKRQQHSTDTEFPPDCLDAQQVFVNNMLLPQGERLASAKDRSVELPYALFDAQKELMQRIVHKGARNLGGGDDGLIALLGGIQINTPESMWDYFLPLHFEIRNNRGEVVANLL